jgi:hypothetical protein
MTKSPHWKEVRIQDAMNIHIAVAREAINASSLPVYLLPPRVGRHYCLNLASYFPLMLTYFLSRRLLKLLDIIVVHDEIVIKL